MQAEHIQLWGSGRPGEEKFEKKKFYKLYVVWKIRDANYFSRILEGKLTPSQSMEIRVEREA